MASRIQGITVEIGGDTTNFNCNALSKVNKEIRDTQSQLKDVNKLLKLDHGTTELMAQKLMPVTAAVGGLGAAAVKIASDFDSGMSRVAAVSGAAGTELDKLREKAREMGAKTKFSVSEAAEAMNYMAMAGWKTGDMLDGIEGIMNLAAASEEDLVTTSDFRSQKQSILNCKLCDGGSVLEYREKYCRAAGR